MGNTCKTCRLPPDDLLMVNLLLVNGVPLRHISAQFKIGTSSLKRHKDLHLPRELVRARQAEQVLQADVLLEEERQDRQQVREQFSRLGTDLKGTDKAFWLSCRREVSKSTELLLRASGLWAEKQAVELSGTVKTEAEKKDAVELAFIECRHPELKDELLEFMRKQREEEG